MYKSSMRGISGCGKENEKLNFLELVEKVKLAFNWWICVSGWIGAYGWMDRVSHNKVD